MNAVDRLPAEEVYVLLARDTPRYLSYFAYSYSKDAHDKKLLNVGHSFVLLLFAMFDS